MSSFPPPALRLFDRHRERNLDIEDCESLVATQGELVDVADGQLVPGKCSFHDEVLPDLQRCRADTVGRVGRCSMHPPGQFAEANRIAVGENVIEAGVEQSRDVEPGQENVFDLVRVNAPIAGREYILDRCLVYIYR